MIGRLFATINHVIIWVLALIVFGLIALIDHRDAAFGLDCFRPWMAERWARIWGGRADV